MDDEKCPWRTLLVDGEGAITTNLLPFLEGTSFAVRAASGGEEGLCRSAISPLAYRTTLRAGYDIGPPAFPYGPLMFQGCTGGFRIATP